MDDHEKTPRSRTWWYNVLPMKNKSPRLLQWKTEADLAVSLHLCWYRCTANASPAWLEGGHCCLGGWTIGRVKYNPWMGTCRVRRAGAKELMGFVRYGVEAIHHWPHLCVVQFFFAIIYFCWNLWSDPSLWTKNSNTSVIHESFIWVLMGSEF